MAFAVAHARRSAGGTGAAVTRVATDDELAVLAAIERLRPYGDYARAINAAFPVNPEADAIIERMFARRDDLKGSRPMPRKVAK